MSLMSIADVRLRWPHLGPVLERWAKKAGIDLKTHVQFRQDAGQATLNPVLTTDGRKAVTDGFTIERNATLRGATFDFRWTHSSGEPMRSYVSWRASKFGPPENVFGPEVDEIALREICAIRGTGLLEPIPVDPSAHPNLSGDVSDPLSIFPMLQSFGGTGRLVLLPQDDPVVLEVWLSRGEIIAAAAGDLQDLDALDLLLATAYSSFTFYKGPQVTRSIKQGTSGILLDLARRRDEGSRPPPAAPVAVAPPKLVPVLPAPPAAVPAMKMDSSNQKKPSRHLSLRDSRMTEVAQVRRGPYYRELDGLCKQLGFYPPSLQANDAQRNLVRAICRRRELIIRTIMGCAPDCSNMASRIAQWRTVRKLQEILQLRGRFVGDASDDESVIQFLAQSLPAQAK